MSRSAAAALLLSLLMSDPCQADLGEAGGLSLLQPPGARSAALGEALTAVSGSPEALGYNPAGLAGLAGFTASGLYHRGFAGDRYVGGLIGQPWRRYGVAARLGHYDAGSVIKSDELTGELSSVSAQRDFTLQGGMAYRFPFTQLAVGISGKFIHESLIEEISASQLAADVGVIMQAPHLGLSFGLAVQNLGPSLRLARDEAALPLIVRAGAAYRAALSGAGMLRLLAIDPENREAAGEAGRHQLLLLADAPFRVREGVTSLGLGLEYTYARALALRAGYRFSLHGTASSEGTLTAGAGVTVRTFTVDYAVEALTFAVLHRIGLTYVPGPRGREGKPGRR